VNSRTDCLTSTNARIILIPPPVEPADVATQDKYSIHNGAKIGHRLKSVFAKPVVLPIDTTLNAANLSEVQKLG